MLTPQPKKIFLFPWNIQRNVYDVIHHPEHKLGELYSETDGYFYLDPMLHGDHLCGSWSQEALEAICDKLRQLNNEVDENNEDRRKEKQE